MIYVTIFTDKEQYVGIDFSGHAGHAGKPVDAQELVCSAVSALTINMSNSVEHFTEDLFQADMDEAGGGFHFRFTSDISSESKLLMNSLVLGLQDIEESYGEPYIKIHIKEV